MKLIRPENIELRTKHLTIGLVIFAIVVGISAAFVSFIVKSVEDLWDKLQYLPLINVVDKRNWF